MKASLKRIIWALGSLFLAILDTTAVAFLYPNYELLWLYQFIWLLVVIVPLLFFEDDVKPKEAET